MLTYAIPHLAVQAQVELTCAHLALADLARARTLMREIDELLRRRPDLGILTGEARALRAQLSTQARSGRPGASSLTGAELRILPLLATHLSLPEIVPVPAHRQVAGVLAVPEARRRVTQPGRRPVRELGLLEG